MAFTNSTPNYNLPQYIATDKPTYLGDANGAYSTIDTRMKANADAASANSNSISLLSARVLANEGKIDDRFTKTESDARYTGAPNELVNGNLLSPVNQRGASNYTGAGVYGIDCWKIVGDYNVVSHTLTYNSAHAIAIAGLSVCAIVQRSDRFVVGETVTMSAKINGTVYSKSFALAASPTSYPVGSFHFIAGVDSSAFFEVAIESSTIVIDWVKLERGSSATPFTPNSYGAELVECMRRFQRIAISVGLDRSTYKYIPTLIPMRASPTYTLQSISASGPVPTISTNALYVTANLATPSYYDGIISLSADF